MSVTDNEIIRSFIQQSRAKDLETIIGYIDEADQEALIKKYMDAGKIAFAVHRGIITDFEKELKNGGKLDILDIIEATDILLIYPQKMSSEEIEEYDKQFRACVFEWEGFRRAVFSEKNVEIAPYISGQDDAEVTAVFLQRKRPEDPARCPSMRMIIFQKLAKVLGGAAAVCGGGFLLGKAAGKITDIFTNK